MCTSQGAREGLAAIDHPFPQKAYATGKNSDHGAMKMASKHMNRGEGMTKQEQRCPQDDLSMDATSPVTRNFFWCLKKFFLLPLTFTTITYSTAFSGRSVPSPLNTSIPSASPAHDPHLSTPGALHTQWHSTFVMKIIPTSLTSTRM